MTATPSLKDNCGSSDYDWTLAGGGVNNWVAGHFHASASYRLTSISFYPKNSGTGSIIVSLRLADANDDPIGSDLAIGSLTSWTGGALNHITMMSSYTLVAGTKYAVVLRASQETSIRVGANVNESHDSGVTWHSYSGSFYCTIMGCSVPTIQTVSAVGVDNTSATLYGVISSMGDYSENYVYFQYGLTTSYGNVTAEQLLTTPAVFSKLITGLHFGSTYHFRAVCRYA